MTGRRDPQTDIVVLKIDAKDLQPIRIGDSDTARVGDWVLAVGSPVNPRLDHSVTSGIISAMGLSQYEAYIQTGAVINPGNSGGPLVNLAEKVANELFFSGETGRGWLGVSIQSISPQLAKALDLKTNNGVAVTGVDGDSLAKNGDLKTEDLIVEFNGRKIDNARERSTKVAGTSRADDAFHGFEVT